MDKWEQDVVDSSDVVCFILEGFTDEEAVEVAQLLMNGIDGCIEALLSHDAIKEIAEVEGDY